MSYSIDAIDTITDPSRPRTDDGMVLDGGQLSPGRRRHMISRNNMQHCTDDEKQSAAAHFRNTPQHHGVNANLRPIEHRHQGFGGLPDERSGASGEYHAQHATGQEFESRQERWGKTGDGGVIDGDGGTKGPDNMYYATSKF